MLSLYERTTMLVPLLDPLGLDGVVPAGTAAMMLDPQICNLRSGYLLPLGIRALPPLRRDPQSRPRRRSAHEAQQHRRALQRDARPVGADRSKQAMLDWVPLRGPRRVVAHHHRQPVAVRHYLLQTLLPQPRDEASRRDGGRALPVSGR